MRADDPVQVLLTLIGASGAPVNRAEESRTPFHSFIGPLSGPFTLTLFNL